MRKHDEVYNVETNSYEAEEELFAGVGVVSNYDISNIGGTGIQIDDVKIMCSFSEEPKTTDFIRFAERDYQVISVTPYKPDGSTVLYYTVQGR